MSIFRQAALDRLCSPDPLGRLPEVTTPKGWLALFGLLAMLAAGVAWSFVARLPTQVSGFGVLVKKGSAIGSEPAGEVSSVGPRAALPEGAADLELVLFLPGADGQRVRPGMPVEVSPSTVRREEHGVLRGTVRSRAQTSPSRESVLLRLGRPAIVEPLFAGILEPSELLVGLQQSDDTPSGYLWTSALGPPNALQPGTLCKAQVTIGAQAPIRFVVPHLQQGLSP